MDNSLARLMAMGTNKPQSNSLADAIRNQQMTHVLQSPISSLQGHDPLTDWGINVAQRFQHPLEAAAGEAQRINQMSPVELAGQFGGGGMQNVGGLLAHTAWHGSPHLFDKFALEKIGTGEGAQAFGHGLYLAENPEVAKQYQKALSEPEYFANGNKLTGNDAWAAQFMHDFDEAGNPIKLTAQQAKEQANLALKNGETKQYILNKIDDLANKDVFLQEGHLYKTDIPDTHIDRMLDWDKPLSQQHPDVQEALKNLGIEPKQTNFYGITPSGEWGITRSGMSDIPGDDIYRMLQDQHGHSAASAKLLEQGIPGIKYLDQGSRTAGEGSRNFVMFNPEDIRILERNSVPTGQVPWGQK